MKIISILFTIKLEDVRICAKIAIIGKTSVVDQENIVSTHTFSAFGCCTFRAVIESSVASLAFTLFKKKRI